MSILTKKDLSDCATGTYECREALREIERIEACGLECQDRKDRANHLIQFFEAVRQQYGSPAQAQSSSAG